MKCNNFKKIFENLVIDCNNMELIVKLFKLKYKT